MGRNSSGGSRRPGSTSAGGGGGHSGGGGGSHSAASHSSSPAGHSGSSLGKSIGSSPAGHRSAAPGKSIGSSPAAHRTASSGAGGQSSSGRISGGRTAKIPASRSDRNSTAGSSRRAPSDSPSRQDYAAPPPGPDYHYHDRPPRHHYWHHDYDGYPPRHRFRRYHSDPYYTEYSGGRPHRSGGCLASLIVLFLIFAVAAIYLQSLGRRETDREAAYQQAGMEEQRMPQEAAAVQQDVRPVSSEYYTDTLGWIEQPDLLNTGMKTFFDQTGVKPYLYLTDNVNGNRAPSDDEMDQFTGELYDKLFADENHFLLVFQEFGDYYMTWYVCGSDASGIIDEQAAEIVLDEIDKYYTDDMEDEDYFSTVFAESARKITDKK